MIYIFQNFIDERLKLNPKQIKIVKSNGIFFFSFRFTISGDYDDDTQRSNKKDNVLVCKSDHGAGTAEQRDFEYDWLGHISNGFVLVIFDGHYEDRDALADAGLYGYQNCGDYCEQRGVHRRRR